MDREALAEFLRRHREQLQPGDVGLSEGVRRRAPGLRREEVAQLALMSATICTASQSTPCPTGSRRLTTSHRRFSACSTD